jgi:hypothetical protein
MQFIDTLLLLALPASGKSEVRKFMLHLPRDRRIDEFHVSDTPQLDDFPYVHYFRCVDDAMVELGHERHFYPGLDAGFAHGQDWGSLLQLVNEDYAVVKDLSAPTPSKDPLHMFARIDAARAKVGLERYLAGLDGDVRTALSEKMQAATDRLIDELHGNRPDRIDDKTLVIEFARGGPDGSDMPLTEPHGYAWNLSNLSPEMLGNAAVLYIWVTPEESRRKNIARCDPDDPGSVMHHSAPESVMLGDYGCDDIEYLIAQSDRPDTIQIEAHGKTWYLPIARFDNRVDKTTFVHGDPGDWAEDDKKALYDGLAGPMQKLWEAYQALHG